MLGSFGLIFLLTLMVSVHYLNALLQYGIFFFHKDWHLICLIRSLMTLVMAYVSI